MVFPVLFCAGGAVVEFFGIRGSQGILWGVLFTLGCAATAWFTGRILHRQVIANPDGLVVHNTFWTYRVPWSAVKDISVEEKQLRRTMQYRVTINRKANVSIGVSALTYPRSPKATDSLNRLKSLQPGA